MNALCEAVKNYGPLAGRLLLALIFHAFWAAAANQQLETIQFMKNLSIMGGMLYVMAFGAGPLSIDNRKRA